MVDPKSVAFITQTNIFSSNFEIDFTRGENWF